MADTTTKTSTPRKTPARPPRPAASKSAPKPAVPAKAATPVAEAAPMEETTKVQLNLGAPVSETKNYSVFDLAKDVDGNSTGCVGKFYAPLGTEEVRILLVGPADVVAGE